MSLIKQHFSLNEEFQLCTLAQLQHEDSNQWTWSGRKLNSWTDDNSETQNGMKIEFLPTEEDAPT